MRMGIEWKTKVILRFNLMKCFLFQGIIVILSHKSGKNKKQVNICLKKKSFESRVLVGALISGLGDEEKLAKETEIYRPVR